MEDENENENKSFIKIFGSDNIPTEKSYSKDFNKEKNTTFDQFSLFSYLHLNDSFNDYNNENKPTNDETICDQNKINLFENEKNIEIFSDFDEFNLYENLEKKPNKIHFGVNNVNIKYNAKKEYLFKKMFTITTEILIKEINEKLINKKLKKVKLISEYNYNNYQICLEKTIRELLSKNEKIEKKISLHEKNEQNLNKILEMNLKEFITDNDEINEKYKKFFNEEFLKDFKGEISFIYYNSIEKLIKEIETNKGNKKKFFKIIKNIHKIK